MSLFEDGLYTPREVATILRLKLATVYKYTREGYIPHVRIKGRGIRYIGEYLTEWLETEQNKTIKEQTERHGD